MDTIVMMISTGDDHDITHTIDVNLILKFQLNKNDHFFQDF